MLTIRQNLLETIHGGKPDRFVNQYEYLGLQYVNPYSASNPAPKCGGEPVKNAWGVTISFPAGMPGAFPVHDAEHIVIKDIEHWRDYVTAPNVKFSDAEWEPYIAMAEEVDRNEYFLAPFVAPGIFEQCHYLLEIQNCLMLLYEEPELMHELIDYITEWELQLADELCTHLHPDCVFHHDDWGTQNSSFMKPEMFEEFYVPAYKKVYGYYRERGVELVVHHSDSYAANLVPYMIEMGIDVWQGVMSTNKIEELIPKYGDKITFMGGIDSGVVDRADWTREKVAAEVERACRTYGKFGRGYIPCNTMGDPNTIYKGVYETISEEIDRMSKIMF